MIMSGWLVIAAIVALLYVTLKALANPVTRPFVIGLGVLAVAGVVLLGLARFWVVQSEMQSVQFQHQLAVQQTQRQLAVQRSQRATTELPPPEAVPPKTIVGEVNRPRMTVIAALRRAVFQVWTGRAASRVVEAQSPPAPPPPAVPRPNAKRVLMHSTGGKSGFLAERTSSGWGYDFAAARVGQRRGEDGRRLLYDERAGRALSRRPWNASGNCPRSCRRP